jgi:5-methylcytosine-specific restriction endonuclease McrA
MRRTILNRDEFTCQACKARYIAAGTPELVTLATMVDHIIAVTGPKDPNFFRGDNLQSLCHPCHNRKGNKVDGVGFQAKKVKTVNVAIAPIGVPHLEWAAMSYEQKVAALA